MIQVTEKTRKDRQKQTAEIFTPDWLVNEMLNQLPKKFWEQNKTYLDPAAGNGQFLTWILIRKIQIGHTPLQALKTIHGIDIMPDNVQECRARLLKVISLFTPIKPTHIKTILTNIVCHDALTYHYEFNHSPTQQEIKQWYKYAQTELEKIPTPFDEIRQAG